MKRINPAVKTFLILCFLISFTINIKGQLSKVKVSLFYEYNIPAVVFSVESGSYQIKADSRVIMTLEEQDVAYLSVVEGEIWVQTIEGGNAGVFGRVELVSANEGGVFSLKPVFPSKDARSYDGDIVFSVEFGTIEMINIVEKDLYLAGVVEAESGNSGRFEFYKTQAVICRTFLYGQTEKYRINGFHVCDAVYCQVYKGRSTDNIDILEAVRQTRDEVITGEGNEIITAAFHANCGGGTVNSEDAWLIHDPVLRSVTDPYCSNGNGFTWQREINIPEWRNYLSGQGFQLSYGVDYSDNYFTRDYKRDGYYSIGSARVSYRKIRNDWNLRSSFFSIVSGRREGTLLIKGRGYGHGVGMCQEGAMEMAARGYSYRDIINFYYTGVSLTDISNLSE